MPEVKHISGNAGGFLVGNSHSNGGIKAINKAIGKPLEMEGGEVVITKPAVDDNELREFEGKMMTNRQILSKINESGGGVSFAELGAELPTQMHCSGSTYQYGGETLSDYEITHRISKCGCNHDDNKLEDGGLTSGNEIMELVISPDNNLSAQLIKHTGDYWNAFDFANIDEIPGDLSFMKPFYHKESGKKFVVVDKSVVTTRKPKYNVGNYVKYEAGDLDKEAWVGKVVEVKDFGNEYAYRIDGYQSIVENPMFESSKTNEKYEVQLQPLKFEKLFDFAKAAYEKNQNQFVNVNKMVVDTNIANYANPYELNRAIEKLLDSKENDDDFTADEKEFITNYSGYGGLEKFGDFSDNELKNLLYEYYTPDAIVKKMWALAYKYGFGVIENPKILEPSVGTGNFFKYAPEQAELYANEINPYSKRICEILYPNANISLQPFEKNFIERNLSIKGKLQNVPKYNLVIGNPPYGEAKSKYLSMGEGDYTKARNFTEYFITRGLDLLLPGGLLIFVVGAEQYNGGTLFLDGGPSEVKKLISEKAQLVDAYRLPRKIFERTGVASEIVVFEKN